jgi:2-dehydropantoate 2-reductase
MKIAVFGTGAVGGYFGGRLAQSGEEVIFIARGKHLQAMRDNGLKIDSINGDFIVQPVQATDNPEEVGIVDMVLVGVKAWQISDAAVAMKSMVGPQTLVLPLQNGVEAPSRSDRVEWLRKAFERTSGITVNIPSDIHVAMWQKFVLITAWSGMGAITRAPIGIFRSQPGTRQMLERTIFETYDVARARDIDLPEDVVVKTMKLLDALPSEGTASMQRDIMDGKPSELESQNGAVVRLGQEAGVETPVNVFIYHSLLPMEMRARGQLQFGE